MIKFYLVLILLGVPTLAVLLFWQLWRHCLYDLIPIVYLKCPECNRAIRPCQHGIPSQWEHVTSGLQKCVGRNTWVRHP